MSHAIDNADDGRLIAEFRVGSIVLIATDIDRIIQWYVDILGCRLVGRNSANVADGDAVLEIRQAWLEGMGMSFELLSTDRTRPDPFVRPPRHLDRRGYGTLMITTSDVAEATRALARRGVDFVWADWMLPDGKSCSLFTDPDGNMLLLIGAPGTPRAGEVGTWDLGDYPSRQAKGPPRLAEGA